MMNQSQAGGASPLQNISMPDALREQSERLRSQLISLHRSSPGALLAEQLRLCAAKLGETIAIYASLQLHTRDRRTLAEQSLSEQLQMISHEADRLSVAIDDESLNRQNTHGSYLRDAFGVSALTLR